MKETNPVLLNLEAEAKRFNLLDAIGPLDAELLREQTDILIEIKGEYLDWDGKEEFGYVIRTLEKIISIL